MKITLILLTSLFCLNLEAQVIEMPTIPEEGVTFLFDQIENNSEPLKFENKGPWDFSSLTTPTTYEMKLLPIKQSTSASKYPKATHFIKSANGEFFYNYANNQISYYGRITENTDASYTNPVVWMNFPLKENSYFVDSTESTFFWMGFEAPLTDKWETQSLGSSTLILPNGTKYENAILVSSTKTMFGGPLGPLTVTYVEEAYYWWVPGSALPVAALEKFYTNDKLQYERSTFLKNGNLSIDLSSLKKIEFYPNPSFSELILNLQSKSDLNIIDLSGRTLLNQTLSAGENAVDISEIPQGKYILEVKNSKSTKREILIKQ